MMMTSQVFIIALLPIVIGAMAIPEVTKNIEGDLTRTENSSKVLNISETNATDLLGANGRVRTRSIWRTKIGTPDDDIGAVFSKVASIGKEGQSKEGENGTVSRNDSAGVFTGITFNIPGISGDNNNYVLPNSTVVKNETKELESKVEVVFSKVAEGNWRSVTTVVPTVNVQKPIVVLTSATPSLAATNDTVSSTTTGASPTSSSTTSDGTTTSTTTTTATPQQRFIFPPNLNNSQGGSSLDTDLMLKILRSKETTFTVMAATRIPPKNQDGNVSSTDEQGSKQGPSILRLDNTTNADDIIDEISSIIENQEPVHGSQEVQEHNKQIGEDRKKEPEHTISIEPPWDTFSKIDSAIGRSREVIVTTPNVRTTIPTKTAPRQGVASEVLLTTDNYFYVRVDTTSSPDKPKLNGSEPEWKSAKQEWGLAWDLHVYIVGALFALLAAYAAFGIIRMKNALPLMSKGYFVSLCLMIFFMGLIRAIDMFHHAYNASGSYSVACPYFIFNVAFPCMTSGFAILFLAMLHATKVQLLPLSVQRPCVLSAVVIFHFALSLTADVVVGHLQKARILLFICQVFFVTWSLCLYLGYFFIFQQLYRAAIRKQGEIVRVTFTKLHMDNAAQLPKKLPRPALGLTVKIIMAIAIMGLVVVGLQLYGMIAVYGIFVTKKPDPWPWWSYQLAFRIFELLMCSSMIFVATQPLRKKESGEGPCSVFSLMTCNGTWDCSGQSANSEDIYPTYCTANQAVSRSEFSYDRWQPNNTTSSTQKLIGQHHDNSEKPPIKCSHQKMAMLQEVGNSSSMPMYLVRRGMQIPENVGYSTTLDHRLAGPIPVFNISGFQHSQSRPSMLFNEEGFIRFRQDDDPEQETPVPEGDYTEINHYENPDLIRNDVKHHFYHYPTRPVPHPSLSPRLPFIVRDSPSVHHPDPRRTSRCSVETMDNSAYTSSTDHMSAYRFKGIHDPSVKYGSTCSSESAANSFDVQFFLCNTNNPYAKRSYHHAAPGHEHISNYPDKRVFNVPFSKSRDNECVHSIADRRGCKGQLPNEVLNLNLNPQAVDHYLTILSQLSSHNQDITPDSAVYLELNTSSSKDELPGDPRFDPLSRKSPLISQSMIDLHKNNPANNPGWWSFRNSKQFLNKIRGSTHSLNASLLGYEPLDSDEGVNLNRQEIWRTNSDDPTYRARLSLIVPGDCWDRKPRFSPSKMQDSGRTCQQQDSVYDSEGSSVVESDEINATYADSGSQTEPARTDLYRHHHNRSSRQCKDNEKESRV